MDRALPKGTKLQEFVIEEAMYSGRFTITYRAQDSALGRKVVLKEYMPLREGTRQVDGTVVPGSTAMAENYWLELERFLWEAQLLAGVRHPQIVRVHRIIEAGGTGYVVMEYVPGRPLAREMGEGPLSEARVRRLLGLLVAGLSEVHEAGLLHRNITPCNVILREESDEPVLVNFTPAREFMDRPTTGELHAFAPIELWNRGHGSGREQGPWTDIYALGAVAHTALSGKTPSLAVQASRRRGAWTSGWDRGISDDLATAVRRAMLRNPSDRPRNLAAWLLDSGGKRLGSETSEYSDQEPLEPGALLVDTEVIRLLGTGAYGFTYLGLERTVDRAVVVKEYMPRCLGSRNPDGTVGPRSPAVSGDFGWGLQQFLTQARILSRLDHPSIVRIHRVVEAQGTAYMVMELVEGRDLADVVRTAGLLSEERLRAMLKMLMSGLAVLHGAGTQHRDIKPANIVLRKGDGRPVLVDFMSLSREVEQRLWRTTVLTPGYAPIERYGLGEPEGPWTDIYSLGATIYFAFTGAAPDPAPDRLNNPVRLTFGDRTVPVTFARALERALAVFPKDRPQDVATWMKMIWDRRGMGLERHYRSSLFRRLRHLLATIFG